MLSLRDMSLQRSNLLFVFVFSFLFFLIVTSIFSATQAKAQSLNAAEINAENTQRELQERQNQQFLRDRENLLRVPVKIAPPTVDPVNTEEPYTRCVHVQTIRISDAPHLLARVQKKIIQQFAGRCLGVNELHAILALITANYIEQGFITARAYIRQQDSSQGVLNIVVVEGQLEKIVIENDSGNHLFINNIFPGAEGQPLNLRDFEQGLEQLNRLSSNNATMEIRPGAQAGGSVVAIKNKTQDRWRWNFSADNEGGESTGRNQTSAGFDWDNPLHINDFFSFTHRRSLPLNDTHSGARSNSASYFIPYGYNLFSLGISQSAYLSTLLTPGGQSLAATGDSLISFLKIDHVAYRDQKNRINLATGLTVKNSKNYLADQLLQVSSRKLTVWDLDVNFSTQLLSGAATVGFGVSQGLKYFDALEDLPDTPDTWAKAQFRKFRYQAFYLRPFQIRQTRFTLNSQLNGQWSNDALYGSEQISIGGIYSVHGFFNANLSGNDGFTWRNELTAHLQIQAVFFQPYIALDYGRVYADSSNAGTQYLLGAALGLKCSFNAVNVELFNSWPISASNGVIPESSRFFLQLRMSI